MTSFIKGLLHLRRGPWENLATVLIALGVVNTALWRKQDALQRALETLQEARLSDRDKQFDRMVGLLVSSLDTSNRVADGMEAMERILRKVKS